MPCILLDFPCVSLVLTRSHCGSILQFDFSICLDDVPKRRHATHCTLYSIFPCILIFILQVYFSTCLDVDLKGRRATHCTLHSNAPCILIDFPTRQSDPWVTIAFDYVLFILFWGSGGCRSHGEGGTLKQKIRSKKRSPISGSLESYLSSRHSGFLLFF